jgi:putative ABC transport system ATP-binding protein
VIEIQNLDKTFHKGTVDELKIIDGLSLTLDLGDFVTIIGSNGAGKSTLMNLVAGTYLPDSGSIKFEGVDVSRKSEHQRALHIGRVFQDPMKGSAKDLSIEENLALAMKRGQKRRFTKALKGEYTDFFKTQLAKLGLGLENRLSDPIGLLSGGQRQAITLLMASLIKPEILLLDEHTAALDPRTAQIVMDITDQIIKEHNLTAMMITHSMEQALKYGNRLVMLHKGQIVFDLKGEERASLTITSLLQKFTQVASL